MRTSRWMLVLALAAFPLLSCGSGDECDECDSDDDCNGGRVCRQFLDENGNRVGQRCASGDGTTTCRAFR